MKVGEDRSERLQVIPAQIYVEVTARPKYVCRNCEGSADEDKPVFRQMPAPKTFIPKSNQLQHQTSWHLFLLRNSVNIILITDNQKPLKED